MTRIPTGAEKVFNQLNVRRWMYDHGTATDYRELAAQAARAFDMWQGLFEYVEPGDPGELAWAFDVAIEVIAERCADWAASDPAWIAARGMRS